jgi:hypothetical protein
MIQKPDIRVLALLRGYRRPRSFATSHISMWAEPDTVIKPLSRLIILKSRLRNGDERGKSIRDRIGHSEFVQAAVINVGASGHRSVGGGEKLRLADPTDKRALSEILEGRAQDVHECISAFLKTFRSAVILRL